MPTKTIELEVQIGSGDDNYVYVDLEYTAVYGDHGIGSYEFWGIKGRDVRLGWEIEEWDWDKSKYSDDVNQKILAHVQNQEEAIFKEFLRLVEND